MDLWIRSQDKTKFIKADCIEVIDNEIFVNDFKFGIYENEERALAVLDDVQKLMLINRSFRGKYDDVDIMIKTAILSEMSKIFILPEK